MRIIVLGYIIRGPLGGVVWHHLQYVLGLHRLGHDVYFIEDSDDYVSCFDPDHWEEMTTDPTFGLKFAAESFNGVGLSERWAYFDAHTNTWLGPARTNARELLRSADLVLNVSGVNPIREWSLDAPHRALIDTDPTFTQVWHLNDERRMRNALTHTAFFSYGENIGAANCSIPNDGLAWLPTRQPIVLDAWPVNPGNPDAHFTTVLQWDSYPPVEYKGRRFGMKSDSFGPYMDLPRRTPQRLEMALGKPTASRERLRDNGWIISNPLEITRTAFTFRQYLQASKGEFSLAKHGYVTTHSGWFSDRSAYYLASGRPVITQNTGFTDWLNTNDGVVAFDSPESAVDAIARVSRDYVKHCQRARAVAEEWFSASAVLSDLVREATRTKSPQTSLANNTALHLSSTSSTQSV